MMSPREAALAFETPMFSRTGLGAPFTRDPGYLAAWQQKLAEASAAGNYADVAYYQGLIAENFGGVDAPPASPGAFSAAPNPSTFDSIASNVSDLAKALLASPVAQQAVASSLARGGVPAKVGPSPYQAPSAPLSTGAKVALGVAGVGLAGGIAYALWPKKNSRRRRNGRRR